MNVFGPLFTWNIFGMEIPSWIIIQWGVMIVLIIAGILLARKLSVDKPSKLQVGVEQVYGLIANLVGENMGSKYSGYVPFVGTLAVYLLILDLCGLIGFGPPTRNLSVVIGFTVITVFLVHYNAIRKKGLGGYFKGYAKPYAMMLPINIIEKVSFPLSLALRLFGNMLTAAIVMGLIYSGLRHINVFAQAIIPIIPHSYFDLFDGVVQTIIFVMLTVITIKLDATED
ncbi:MAG: F0F1 ATP synthase subunit A [Sarcina sp.]